LWELDPFRPPPPSAHTHTSTQTSGVWYDDSSWKTGKATLGYGVSGVVTKLGYGNNVTTYFRKMVSLYSTRKFTWTLGINYDDGVVVYINGKEVMRAGLPAAPAEITPTTPANSRITGAMETFYRTMTLPATALADGMNFFAVEVSDGEGRKYVSLGEGGGDKRG
jgi:hypothetical protein